MVCWVSHTLSCDHRMSCNTSRQLSNVMLNIQPKCMFCVMWVVCLCVYITSFLNVYLLEHNQWHTGWHIAVKCEVMWQWYLLMQGGISSKPLTHLLWDDSQTSLTSDLCRMFCKPCRIQVCTHSLPSTLLWATCHHGRQTQRGNNTITQFCR